MRVFLKAVSQGRIPKRQFTKWQFPNSEISQLCNFPSVNFPRVRSGLLDTAGYKGGQALQLGWTRGQNRLIKGPSDAPKTDLESYCLRNCTVGKFPLGKIPLVSGRLEKSP